MIIRNLLNTAWRLAEKLCYPYMNSSTIVVNVNFISNNIEYTRFKTTYSSSVSQLIYENDTGSTIAYDYKLNDWVDQNCRTIEFIGGAQIDDPALIGYINLIGKCLSNTTPATIQEPAAKIVYQDETLATLTPGQNATIGCDNKIMSEDLVISAPVSTSEMPLPESAKWPYILFKSPNDFTITSNEWDENPLSWGGGWGDEEEMEDYWITPTKGWDGIIEYSTNTIDWQEWDGTTTLSSENGHLYLRGTGNTVITGYEGTGQMGGCAWIQWDITGENIQCIGNLENLLDYQKVANGEHPEMLWGCFYYMFLDCKAIISAFDLLADYVAEDACYSMYSGCYNLTKPGRLPATQLGARCYQNMFSLCALEELPALPATELSIGCYHGMFRSGYRYDENWNYIETTPIKTSLVQTEECPFIFKVPTFGQGILPEDMWGSWDYPTSYLFSGTTELYAITPIPNATYYTNIPTYGTSKLQKKKVMENGTVLPDPGYEGLSEVEVAVYIPKIEPIETPIVENGTYNASDFELDGIKEITVKVPIPEDIGNVWSVLDGEMRQGQLAYGEQVSAGDFVELVKGFSQVTFTTDITGDVYGGRINDSVYAIFYKTAAGLKLRAVNVSTSPATFGPECLVTSRNCSQFEFDINGGNIGGLTYLYQDGAYTYVNAYLYQVDPNTLVWTQLHPVFERSGLVFVPGYPGVVAVNANNFMFAATAEGMSNYSVNLSHVSIDDAGTVSTRSSSFTTGTQHPKMRFGVMTDECLAAVYYYGGTTYCQKITLNAAAAPGLGDTMNVGSATVYNVCSLDPEDVNYTLFCETATLKTVGGLSVSLPDASEAGLAKLDDRSALVLTKGKIYVARIVETDGVETLTLTEQGAGKNFTYVARTLIMNSITSLAAPMYENASGRIYSIIYDDSIYQIKEVASTTVQRAAVTTAQLGIAMQSGVGGDIINVLYPRMPYPITWNIANAFALPESRHLFWDRDFNTTLGFPDTYFPNEISVSGCDYTWNPDTYALYLYNPVSAIQVDLSVIQKFNIEYELNGGILENPLVEYTVGNSYVLPRPTKANDTFVGWYTSEFFEGDEVVTLEPTQTGHLKFYAAWESMIHSITYNVPAEFVAQELVDHIIDGQTKTIIFSMPNGSYVPSCSATNVTIVEEIDLANATYTLTLTDPTPGDIVITITYIINKVPVPEVEVVDDILTITDNSETATGFTVYIDGTKVSDIGDITNSIDDKGEIV